MTRKMLIDAAHPEEVRVCVLENGKVEDFDFEYSSRKPLRGNIYLARVTRVEPSLQAAFVEYGGNRHGFLAFNEIHPDYYQIPVSDRRLLQEAEAEEADLAAQLDLGQRGDEGDEGDIDLDGDGAEAARFDDLASDDDDGPGVSEVSTDGDRAAAETAGDDADDGDADEDGDHADAQDGEPAEAAAFDSAPLESVTAPSDAHPEDAPDAEDHDEGAPEDASGSAADDGDDDAEAEGETETKSRRGGDKPRGAKRAELLERYKEARRKRLRIMRNYKIQEVIKRRQILLVQVVKEERGNKGAALTTYMSLAGRYCVLMPNTARGGGISRKIPVAGDRKRLRRVVDSLDLPQGMGLIIRTAGAKRTKAEIKRDYDYLIRLWETIRSLTLKSIAPCLIYEEASLIKRAIRDLYDKDIDQILVDGDAGYREAKDFMKMLMPSHAKNVQPYKDKTPLFLRYDVESQLDAMYQPVVRLKSGGYIVIHQTEALVAIDVNSGKATRERNIELTALKTNVEAAKEAARQCRMRDLAGLIVIDFIDMEENKNNRTVEKKLKDALKDDRARIQVGRISNFGLLEMSRQRRRSGIVDGTTHSCPTCAGAGVVRTHEMAGLRILRAIESAALTDRSAVIAVKASLEVTLYILNHKRDWLKRIEDDYAVSVEVVADSSKAGDQYELEKRGAPRDLPVAAVIRPDQFDVETHADPVEADAGDAEDEDEQPAPAEASEGGEGGQGGRRRRRRRRRRRDGAAPGQGPEGREDSSVDGASDAEDDSDEPLAARDNEAGETAPEESGDGQRRRRRRGRRGGRRNNRRPDQPAEAGAPEESGGDEPFWASAEADETSEREPEPSSAQESGAEQPFIPEAPEEELADEPEQESYEPAFAANDQPEPAPAPQPAAVDEPPAEKQRPAQDKPNRKGWWQKAIGG
ncbi:MAG: Rne/Rng family ribonuclease [Pseudomonadota bacterium]|nr:Rne/Rng family ribonuclease [Pseudomonadota bacterium]